MIITINGDGLFYYENDKIVDNWRNYLIWRIAKEDIDKEKFNKIKQNLGKK